MKEKQAPLLMRTLLFLLLLVASTPPAFSQVAFDAAAQSDTSNAVILVFPLTVASNADRNLLIFWGGSSGSSACSVTAADFNGDMASLVIAEGLSTAARVEIWHLTAPDTGTHDVTITTNCTGFANYARGGAVSFYTSHQGSPLGTPLDQTVTSGSTLTLAPGSTSGDLVANVAMWQFDPGTITLGAGQTQRVDLGFRMKVTTETAAGANTTMSFTTANDHSFYVSAAHATVAVKILTAAAPASFPGRRRRQ